MLTKVQKWGNSLALRIPDSGDIIWIMFNPQAGHEQAGYRPAFVLSPKAITEKSV
ncbi:MAG: type II toxin-antitoxin system PemK/MazF family toxin [Anaerolineales bacterium]|jgi:mRNA interferase MazF|nr:type II toxin-antitoxin system PemK/MazF family toxin [Anaerolineales bacterium]